MRIPVSTIVDSQLPLFVREEYPLFSEFLRQYYLSDKSEELIQNLDKNIDLDVVFNIRLEAILDQNVGFNDTTITVDSTEGFPDNNGLIKIDNEIILYKSKSDTEFIQRVGRVLRKKEGKTSPAVIDFIDQQYWFKNQSNYTKKVKNGLK